MNQYTVFVAQTATGHSAHVPEQALAGEIVDLDYRVTDDGQERWTVMGQTSAGRLLVIVWTVLDNGFYRPITAYPATKNLEFIYHRVIEGKGT